jgi:hypothetical protein
MIIGVSGFARSGKDTVATTLVNECGYERVAFADAIRDILYAMNPRVGGDRLVSMVDEYGWDVAKAKEEVRELLQSLGYAARQKIGEGVWIEAALRNLSPDKNYVIADVRFQNEAETIRMLGGEIWRVERPDVTAVNPHISEVDMSGYTFDEVLENDGTLEQLEFLVKKLAYKIL